MKEYEKEQKAKNISNNYQLTDEEWELVNLVSNFEGRSKSEWQEHFSIKTKEDWKIEEEVLNELLDEALYGDLDKENRLIETFKKPLLEIRIPQLDPSLKKIPLKELNLSIQTEGWLKRAGYNSVFDLSDKSYNEFLEIQGFDKKRVSMLFYRLDQIGVLNGNFDLE